MSEVCMAAAGLALGAVMSDGFPGYPRADGRARRRAEVDIRLPGYQAISGGEWAVDAESGMHGGKAKPPGSRCCRVSRGYGELRGERWHVGQTAVDVDGAWRDTQDTQDTQDRTHRSGSASGASGASRSGHNMCSVQSAECRQRAQQTQQQRLWGPGPRRPPGPRWARPAHAPKALCTGRAVGWRNLERQTHSPVSSSLPVLLRDIRRATPVVCIAPLPHSTSIHSLAPLDRPPNPPNPLTRSLTHSPTHPLCCVCVCVCVCVCALSAPSSRSLCFHTTHHTTLLASALLPAIFRHHQPWRMLLPLSPTSTHPSA
jgi:hypothetical protein